MKWGEDVLRDDGHLWTKFRRGKSVRVVSGGQAPQSSETDTTQ